MSPLSEAGFGPRRTETLAGHLTAGIRSDLVMVNDCGLGADERLVRHRRRLSSHPIHARTSTRVPSVSVRPGPTAVCSTWLVGGMTRRKPPLNAPHNTPVTRQGRAACV